MWLLCDDDDDGDEDDDEDDGAVVDGEGDIQNGRDVQRHSAARKSSML